MLAIVSGGPWNVEDHLLILQPWQEHFQNFYDEFYLVDFWVQIWGLPVEWVFGKGGMEITWISKELFGDAVEATMELQEKVLLVHN